MKQNSVYVNEDMENQNVGQSGFQTSADFDDMIVEDLEIGEALEARQIPDVPQPSKQERVHHELLHMPYRIWCAHCVKGRGIATQHKKCNREDKKGVSQITMDYFFPAKEITCLAVKDVDSQAVMGLDVPKKGGGNAWTVKRIQKCIDEYWGRKRVTMK